MAIDLTVCEGGVEEQSSLVQGCTTAVQLLLDRVGMNSRGLVKRVAKERFVPVIAVVKEKAEAKTGKKRDKAEDVVDAVVDSEHDEAVEEMRKPKKKEF